MVLVEKRFVEIVPRIQEKIHVSVLGSLSVGCRYDGRSINDIDLHYFCDKNEMEKACKDCGLEKFDDYERSYNIVSKYYFNETSVDFVYEKDIRVKNHVKSNLQKFVLFGIPIDVISIEDCFVNKLRSDRVNFKGSGPSAKDISDMKLMFKDLNMIRVNEMVDELGLRKRLEYFLSRESFDNFDMEWSLK